MKRTFLILAIVSVITEAGLAEARERSRSAASPKPLPKDIQYRTAVHEIGHALVGEMLRPHDPVTSVMVSAFDTDEDDDLGAVRHAGTEIPETIGTLMAEVAEDLGGRAAEIIVFGSPTIGDRTDLKNANKLLTRICAEEGLCGSLLLRDKTSPWVEAAVERCLGAALVRAEALLRANAETLKAAADHLLKRPVRDGKRVLSGKAFRAFLKTRALVTETEAGIGVGRTCE